MTLDLAHLIPTHGYWVALVGAILEGETVLVLAGLAANRGYLNAALLVVVGALGGFVGDLLYFAIGRRIGARVLARFPRLQPAAARVDTLVHRHPHLFVIGVRFIYGLRTIGPIAIGMTRMRWAHFALLNAAGAIFWSACWVGVGYLAGTAIEAAMGRLGHADHRLFSVALLLAIVLTAAMRWRRYRRSVRKLAASSPPARAS
jgi:membrane protein DedA with SNARE-associated domain